MPWLTVSREVEEIGQLPGETTGMTGVWKTRVRISQLVKEGMDHGVNRGEPLGGGIFEEGADKVDGIMGSFAENLRETISNPVPCPLRQSHTLLNGCGLI